MDSDNSPPQLPLAPCSEKDVSCEDDDECPVCLDAHAGKGKEREKERKRERE